MSNVVKKIVFLSKMLYIQNVVVLGGVQKLKITSVKVKKIEKENSKMKGIASIFLDDEIAIHDIRILEGNSGLYIAMPSRKKSI